MSVTNEIGLTVGGIEQSRDKVSERERMVRKVAGSSFMGNFIEWFDYASYSYFATTIAAVFFPSTDRTVADVRRLRAVVRAAPGRRAVLGSFR